jgi:putative ABC transport system permease protein
MAQNRRKAKHPPRLFSFILKHMSLYDAHHSRLGDFEESFRLIAETKGITPARLWYAGQVTRSMPEYLRLLLSTGFGLLYNYVKLALRNLGKHRMYAAINIAGLAVGLATAILIFLFVRFETSFDRYHPDSDRVFRVVDQEYTAIPFILGDRLVEQSPEIEAMVRLKEITTWGTVVVEAEGKPFLENKILMAEPSLFRILSYKFLSGGPDSALSHPGALVLTESSAIRYFGHSGPLGKTLEIRGIPFQVGAVIADIASNTHFRFNVLISAAAETRLDPRSDDQRSWSSSNYKTYLKVIPQADTQGLEKRLNDMYAQGRREPHVLHLQPLTGIHLHSHLRSEFEANGDFRNVRFAAAIGLTILLVAVLNFMNLASAHSLHRGREVGLRKVLGAQRKQLIRQFLGEALVFVLLASCLALAIAYGSLPYFRKLTGSDLGWVYVSWPALAGFLISLVLVVGVAAGSYPAFFASGFQPAKALRGDKLTGSHRVPLRNLLVGVQFIITLVFVCAALIIWMQMRYVKNRQMGMVEERIVYIELPIQARHHHLAIKTELTAHPGVVAAAASDFLPSTNSQNIGSTWEGRIGSEDVYLAKVAVDIDFMSTFGIEMLTGEPFSAQHRPGSSYIVNATAARLIGGGEAEAAVGKILTMGTWTSRPGRIVGVVRDFHFRSLHRVIEPLVLFLDASRTVTRPSSGVPYRVEPFRYVSARVRTEDLPEVLDHVRALCRKFIPYAPDSWSFFDRDYARLYAKEQRVSRFMITLAFTAVLLASMGLLGLSIYAVEKRRKEIGIRRVMGASTSAILFLFFKDFFRIHLVAMLIAFPAIAFAMQSWLENFAYRIALAPWIFVLSGLITALLFFVTSSLNVYRSAEANPAEVLRSE